MNMLLYVGVVWMIISFSHQSFTIPSKLQGLCEQATQCNPKASLFNSLQLPDSRMLFIAKGSNNTQYHLYSTHLHSDQNVTTKSVGVLGSLDESEASLFVSDVDFNRYYLLRLTSGKIYLINTETETPELLVSVVNGLPIASGVVCNSTLFVLYYTLYDSFGYLVSFDEQSRVIEELHGITGNSQLVCLDQTRLVVSSDIELLVLNIMDNSLSSRYPLCTDASIADCKAVRQMTVASSNLFFIGMNNTNIPSLYQLDANGIQRICDSVTCANPNYLFASGQGIYYFTSASGAEKSSQILFYRTGDYTFKVSNFTEQNLEFYSTSKQQKRLSYKDAFIYTVSSVEKYEIWYTHTTTQRTLKLYSSSFYIDNLVADPEGHALYFTELQSVDSRPTISSQFTFAQLQRLDMKSAEAELVHIQCRSADCGSLLLFAPVPMHSDERSIVFANMQDYEQNVELYYLVKKVPTPEPSESFVAKSSSSAIHSPSLSGSIATSSTKPVPGKRPFSVGLVLAIIAGSLALVVVVVMSLVLIIRRFALKKEYTQVDG